MVGTIDDIDHRILGILQDNARISNADIAREVGMAPSATLERVRKLEERGLLKGYEARLDHNLLGRGLTAFIFVRSNEMPVGEGAAKALAAIEEVLEVHHVAGEDCFLVKVRAADTRDLHRLIRERLGAIPQVTSTRTTIVLETVKETLKLSLNGAG
ncbi:MAG TPA: Lrp/AsnC family transcriptional regulator [Gemmatimonadales bacterium]|jgi:Lrp/AsnC family leucine-responsive transcriptional regulator